MTEGGDGSVCLWHWADEKVFLAIHYVNYFGLDHGVGHLASVLLRSPVPGVEQALSARTKKILREPHKTPSSKALYRCIRGTESVNDNPATYAQDANAARGK